MDGWMDGWMDFTSISVIPGRWVGDNERLCALKLRLQLNRSPPQAGLGPGTARPLSQHVTY